MAKGGATTHAWYVENDIHILHITITQEQCLIKKFQKRKDKIF